MNTLNEIQMIIIFIALCFISSSCTYSINMIHSEGSATDLIDENQRADADVRPVISVPAPAI